LGAVGEELDPVIEGLLAGAGEIGAAFFHFDQDDGLPDVVGEGGAALFFLAFLMRNSGEPPTSREPG
jgi:hypothetical protein